MSLNSIQRNIKSPYDPTTGSIQGLRDFGANRDREIRRKQGASNGIPIFEIFNAAIAASTVSLICRSISPAVYTIEAIESKTK